MSPAGKAPAQPITITKPSADGATFDGTAEGRVDPPDSGVTAYFWPLGNGVGSSIRGDVTVVSTKWTATFDMTGVAATTVGFLSVTNDATGAETHRSNLVWNPPQTNQTVPNSGTQTAS